MHAAGMTALAFLWALWPELVPPRPAPYEPVQGCYLGAYIELDPKVRDDIGVFESLVGKRHASYFHYVGYGRPFPFEWAKKLREGGYVPHIAWEPNDGLAQVEDDDYLRGWAQAARHADTPIFLRYASEMNGDWQAWSGDPKLYIDKWRTVARVMREVAPKVILVWCPFAQPQRTIPDYYPGDEYVDWVGVNIYSVLRHDGDPAKLPSEQPTELLRHVYDLYADRKPIAVCEYAATHFCAATGQSCTDFALKSMRQMYESLPSRFPRVKMINWFSVDAAHSGIAHNDYALTTNDQKLALYRELIASEYFLSELVEGGVPAMVIAGTPATEPGEQATTPGLPPPPPGLVLAADALVEEPPESLHIAVLGAPPAAVRGRIEVVAQVPETYVGHMVTVLLDERIKVISNAPPFSFSINADLLKPGPHKVRVQVSDAYDRPLVECEAGFVVAEPA